jgi:glucokinase
MLNLNIDKRIVLTLDAGGTNFIFGAMQGGKEVIKPFSTPSNADDLDMCLNTIIDGFEKVKLDLNDDPVAISFAFPGPANYEKGIIGDLNNLPAFKGGIALGPMLEKKFGIPVFIQNDGDLFTYGEAMGGILPEINAELSKKGIHKRYNNLVGLTLGTGFGAGVVSNNILYKGDNSVPAEIWNTSNSVSPERNAEDGVSTRIIISDYCAIAGVDDKNIMPFDIYQVAKGEKEGNAEAAIKAFHNFGLHLGDAIANLILLYDSLVVIGGGIAGAKELYMPAIMSVLNGSFKNGSSRSIHKIYNLDSVEESSKFFDTTEKEVKIPYSDEKIIYDPVAKSAIVTSKLGASKAIAIGAYAYALNKLDETDAV